MKPLLAMIYMEGCGACEQTKPEFQKFAARYPNNFQFGMMDIDKATVPFPVEITPSFVLRMPKGVYKTDPVALNEDITADTLGRWVANAVRDYRSRGL